MKINSVNPGMSLIPYYEFDYSDESWCIFKFQQLVSEPIYASIRWDDQMISNFSLRYLGFDILHLNEIQKKYWFMSSWISLGISLF